MDSKVSTWDFASHRRVIGEFQPENLFYFIINLKQFSKLIASNYIFGW